MEKSFDSSKSGTAILVVLAFTFLAVMLSAVLLRAAGTQGRQSARMIDVEQAQFVAEAGVERAADFVEANNGYLPNNTTASGSVGGGTFNYTISKVGWRTYDVVSTGTVQGVSRRVALNRLYIPTYAKFALWMHTNGRIYFIPGEEFFGQVHSNDKLWFYSNSWDGGPVFWEMVSSAWSSYGGNLDYVTFHEGFQTSSTQGSMADVHFASGSDPAGYALEDLANSFGIVLEGRTYVEFKKNEWEDGVQGVARVTNERAGWSDKKIAIGQDQIIYVKNSSSGDSSTRAGKLYVDGGSVRGSMTIATENDIIIRDHIKYATNPISHPDSTDALGLISKDDIWVSTDAPNNLKIFAAMMAAGQYSNNRGSFGVLNYNSGSHRGALQIHGGIVQDKRGAVGTFNSNGPVSGFYKDYTFDNRFETKPPPYYPVVDEDIDYESWEDGPVT